MKTIHKEDDIKQHYKARKQTMQDTNSDATHTQHTRPGTTNDKIGTHNA